MLRGDLRAELLELERKRADAMVRQDIAALSDLLADDLSYVHSDARTDTKDSFLALIAGTAIRYLAVEFSDREVIDCGDAAIVRGRARLNLIKEPGGRQEYVVLFLDIWARRNGRWQMVAWHATRVP
jgi:ketosteroid isomerase-like protein